jgi:AraC-like DNA-binding protein
MTVLDNNIDRSRHSPNRPPRRSVTVSIRSVRPLLGYLASRGYDAGDLRLALGQVAVDIEDPESRIPHDAAVALWDAAERLSADINIGLHAAEWIRPGMLGALEYAVQTCATLGHGLKMLARYHRVLHDVAEVRVELRGNWAVLSHRLPLPGGAPRQISEFVLAGWLLAFRRICATEWAPLEVRFPHAEPADVSEHRRLFAAPLLFGHERSELRIPRALLDQPLPAADSTLQQIVEAQVGTLLESLPAADSYTDSVRRLLARTLNAGSARLEEIAAQLHLSPRTLHRRLDEEGTSFRRIVCAVRRELAERHLRDRRMMIAEVAFLLGYSEASAFHRAFKRWTGHSPQAFRDGAYNSSSLERGSRYSSKPKVLD